MTCAEIEKRNYRFYSVFVPGFTIQRLKFPFPIPLFPEKMATTIGNLAGKVALITGRKRTDISNLLYSRIHIYVYCYSIRELVSKPSK